MSGRSVREVVGMLAGEVSDEAAGALGAYAALVRETGKRWNLMSQGALRDLDEHLVDSAAVLSAVEFGECDVGDLGSGAGLPGVVLAILRPAIRMTLIDSRRSKVVFLEQAVRRLELGNARVLHERLERVAEGALFDVAVSRALGGIEETLRPSLALVRPGGRLVLYKGPKWKSERETAAVLAGEAGAVLEDELDVELPGFGRTTTFAVFRAGVAAQ